MRLASGGTNRLAAPAPSSITRELYHNPLHKLTIVLYSWPGVHSGIVTLGVRAPGVKRSAREITRLLRWRDHPSGDRRSVPARRAAFRLRRPIRQAAARARLGRDAGRAGQAVHARLGNGRKIAESPIATLANPATWFEGPTCQGTHARHLARLLSRPATCIRITPTEKTFTR